MSGVQLLGEWGEGLKPLAATSTPGRSVIILTGCAVQRDTKRPQRRRRRRAGMVARQRSCLEQQCLSAWMPNHRVLCNRGIQRLPQSSELRRVGSSSRLRLSYSTTVLGPNCVAPAGQGARPRSNELVLSVSAAASGVCSNGDLSRERSTPRMRRLITGQGLMNWRGHPRTPTSRPQSH